MNTSSIFAPRTASTTTTNATDSNAGGNATVNSNDSLSQNSFLSLLVTQLQNQDPSQPVDDSQWLSELANFSSLQQMQDINSTLTGQSGLTQIAGLSSMIGKTATTSALDSNGNAISGIITAASVQGGTLTLTIGNNQVPLTSVTGISQTTTGSGS